MRRVAVHGSSGSGKSTLARALAQKLGVPYVELDALWHEPDWKEAELDVFRERVAEAIEPEGWVVDGNYWKAKDLVYAKCDTVIWLDYPLPLILWRLTRRTLRRGIRREVLWKGNRESVWRHFFTRDSLYLWVLQTYRRRRQQCRETLADDCLAHIQRIAFRRPGDAKRWLNALDLEETPIVARIARSVPSKPDP